MDSDEEKPNGFTPKYKPIFEPSADSSISRNFLDRGTTSSNHVDKGKLSSSNSGCFKVLLLADAGNSSDEDPVEYLRDLKRRVHFSDRSQRVLDDSNHLLKSIRSRRTLPPPIAGSCSMSTIPTSLDRKGDQSMQDRAEKALQRSRRSLSPEECAENAST